MKQFCFCVLSVLMSTAVRADARTDPGPVIYNTDGCDMLDYPVDDPHTYESFVAQRLARDVPGSAVTTVGYCPVSSGFGHFTALKMGDTLLNPLPPGSMWRGRKVYNATGDFAKEGLDALEMGLRYAREQKRAAMVSIRMNDTHDAVHRPDKPDFLFSPFKQRHPECLMGTPDRRPPFCAWSAVDYSQPLVRETFLGYVRQLAENYEFDGLDLDFFRHVQCFKSVAWGAESASDAERKMLTEMIGGVRKILDAYGRKRGRRPFLCVRTPDSPDYCRAVGIDIESWLRLKYVDVWCGSGYFRLRPWRESAELAHRHGAKFYASLDESRIERQCARQKRPWFDGRNSRANFAARVAAAAEEGCDGVEFFNIDDYPDSERKAIAALSPGRTDGLDKDYFLVNRGSGGYSLRHFLKDGARFRTRPPVDPGQSDVPKLKANEPYAFPMTLSDDFAGRSKAARVTVEVLLQPTLPNGQLPTLSVNGKDVGKPTVPRKDVITFSVPTGILKRGANAFSVTSPAACEFRDFVLRVRHGEPERRADSAPKVRGRGKTLPSDFETSRADGRFDNHMAFALDYIRRMVPEHSFDKVRDAAELPAWRAKVRARLGELLMLPKEIPQLDFRLLKEEKRIGYRLYRYEFYPEARLAIPILVLVPESAIAGGKKVPAVVCMPGSGASLNSLAGEPDEYGNHYPARNRQAWHCVQLGMVGVAIENPATAESGVRELNHYVTQAQFARLMTLAGRSNWGFMVEHVLETIDFLKRHPNVDAKRIAVSGMSLGCIPTLYAAVMSDDVAAVIYNDFVSSWAANAVSVTKGLGGSADARRPFGFHRWFDDEPDLMAAVAPRPMIFVEGGAWKNCIEKVRKAYRMAGAEGNLRISYYEKYSDPATRRHEEVDLHRVTGLSDDDYLRMSNVDAGQHGFHPDVVMPWISEVFFGKGDLAPRQKAMLEASVKWPAWQQMPLDYEVE